jgi:hypothetical protein
MVPPMAFGCGDVMVDAETIERLGGLVRTTGG